MGRHDSTDLPPRYNRQAVTDGEETLASKGSLSLQYIMKGLFDSLSDGLPHDDHQGMCVIMGFLNTHGILFSFILTKQLLLQMSQHMTTHAYWLSLMIQIGKRLLVTLTFFVVF